MVRHTRPSADHTNSSGAETSNARAGRTRRFHTKSRNGCTECKNRHIRCDERRPSCENCEDAGRTCLFPPKRAGKQKHIQRQGLRDRPSQRGEQEATTVLSPGSEESKNSDANTIANTDVEHAKTPPLPLRQQNNASELAQARNHPSHRSPFIAGFDTKSPQISSPPSPTQLPHVHTPPPNSYPGLSSVTDSAPEAIFTPQHMILLYHAHTVPNMTGPNRNAVDIAIRRAVDSPYLLDEILAFTAFHMASLYPGSAAYLQNLATELQTRALASFTRLTEEVPNDDKATAVPRFLFSAILGRHALAETLAYYRSDFNVFIDRLVECFSLNRGITSVTPPARLYLYTTELQPFLNVILEAQNKISSPGNECDPLSRLMDDSDISEASAKACRQAIEVLQWAFDICRVLDEENYPQAVSAFSVRVDATFEDMLRKHRPEALVILAYFGVLLHRCRGFWAFGDAGASMIRAIAENLGSYWQDKLAWPLHVVKTGRISQPVTPAPTGDPLPMSFHTPF